MNPQNKLLWSLCINPKPYIVEPDLDLIVSVHYSAVWDPDGVGWHRQTPAARPFSGV